MTRLGMCFLSQAGKLQDLIPLQFVASELRCSHPSALSRLHHIQIVLGSLAAGLLELALLQYPHTSSDSAMAAADLGTSCLPGLLSAFGGGRSDHLLQRQSLHGTSLHQTCRPHP